MKVRDDYRRDKRGGDMVFGTFVWVLCGGLIIGALLLAFMIIFYVFKVIIWNESYPRLEQVITLLFGGGFAYGVQQVLKRLKRYFPKI